MRAQSWSLWSCSPSANKFIRLSWPWPSVKSWESPWWLATMPNVNWKLCLCTVSLPKQCLWWTFSKTASTTGWYLDFAICIGSWCPVKKKVSKKISCVLHSSHFLNFWILWHTESWETSENPALLKEAFPKVGVSRLSAALITSGSPVRGWVMLWWQRSGVAGYS